MNVVFIGAGNLATQLALHMQEKGMHILQVFSQTEASASRLALLLGCDHTTSLQEVKAGADLYLFAVKDNALADVIAQMPHQDGIWAHTAGSVPLEALALKNERYGVFYPLQTFSKTRKSNFAHIPFFIEASDEQTKETLLGYARELSPEVHEASSAQRMQMHLAAVFACNFANHMFVLAQDILTTHGLPMHTIAPLIQETAAKVGEMSALAAQTGPATRMDTEVIHKHLAMLEDEHTQELYEKISQNIYRYTQQS